MILKDAVLEIGCEELPSSYIRPAIDQMVVAAESSLRDHRISYQRLYTYYTPRRLALFFKNLPEMQQDTMKEVTGPLVSIAFDEHGLPTRAGEGFAKAQGVSAASLKRKQTPKGEVVLAIKKGGGRLSSEILAEVFPEVIKKIRFPKVQRWGNGDFLFARPIRWICAVYSRTVIPFEIAGLYSSRETYGLRALKQGPLDVVEAGDYLEVVRQGGVIADPDERRNMIWNKVQQAAAEKGAVVYENPELLDDVNNLVESPDVIMGSFDPKYLALPAEVIVTAMREHQKYFAVHDGHDKLLPYFISVINGTPKDKQIVVRANEGVLKARLEDAKFFVTEDMKLSLENWAEKLTGITWLEGMGTMADKAVRLQKLGKKLVIVLGLSKDTAKTVEEAALLCKADLATNIIREKEFNRLQGVMGGIYAERQGKIAIGEAIRYHYYPRFSGDILPEGTAAILSIADKLDTVVGCFRTRLIPTGSQDPLALRRQALGVLQILLANKYAVSLEELIKITQEQFAGKAKPKEKEEVLEFLKGRLQSVLESKNISYDVVNAVAATEAPTFIDLIEKAETVSQFKMDKDFQELATAAGRVLRILPEKKLTTKLSTTLLKHHEEKELHKAVEAVAKALAISLEKRDYVDVRHNLQLLVKPIHTFFEKILVMDKDTKIKNNRLVLLRQTADVLLALCDFRKLVYASETSSQSSR